MASTKITPFPKPDDWSDQSFAFQLLAWRSAVKLEETGLRHSSGRSVRKYLRNLFGCTTANIIPTIEATLALLPRNEVAE